MDDTDIVTVKALIDYIGPQLARRGPEETSQCGDVSAVRPSAVRRRRVCLRGASDVC